MAMAQASSTIGGGGGGGIYLVGPLGLDLEDSMVASVVDSNSAGTNTNKHLGH